MNSLSEAQLDCLARVLRRLCSEAGLNADEIFEEAALETAGNFGDKDDAPDLLASLRLT